MEIVIPAHAGYWLLSSNGHGLQSKEPIVAWRIDEGITEPITAAAYYPRSYLLGGYSLSNPCGTISNFAYAILWPDGQVYVEHTYDTFDSVEAWTNDLAKHKKVLRSIDTGH